MSAEKIPQKVSKDYSDQEEIVPAMSKEKSSKMSKEKSSEMSKEESSGMSHEWTSEMSDEIPLKMADDYTERDEQSSREKINSSDLKSAILSAEKSG